MFCIRLSRAELMKLGGKLFFEWDLQMYDEGIDEPAKANTSDINEELGQVMRPISYTSIACFNAPRVMVASCFCHQVEYLFSDKTGTLTENIMHFRQCCVSSLRYEQVDDDHLRPVANSNQATPEPLQQRTVRFFSLQSWNVGHISLAQRSPLHCVFSPSWRRFSQCLRCVTRFVSTAWLRSELASIQPTAASTSTKPLLLTRRHS